MLYPLSYEGGATNLARNRRSEAVHRQTIEDAALGLSGACPLGAHWRALASPDFGPHTRVGAVRARL